MEYIHFQSITVSTKPKPKFKTNNLPKAMSNRLESLNSKKPSSSSPGSGLKFKPKVVQRKSKEERAKSAPRVKEENADASRTSARGRGGSMRGKGRGGRSNYAGTHLVTQGPLSAGSVGIGNSSGSKLGLTSDLIYSSSGEVSAPDFISKLKLKQAGLKGENSESASSIDGSSSNDNDDNDLNDDDDDDNDPTKINMTKEYRFEDSEVELFPHRPYRDDGIQRPKPTSIKVKEEQSPVKLEPSVSATPEVMALHEVEAVKSEDIEDKIASIKVNKAKLESKITQTDSIVQDESEKLITDHQQIVDLLMGDGNNGEEDDTFVLFQLPSRLPEYKQEESKVKLEKDLIKVEPGEEDAGEGEEEKVPADANRSVLSTNTSTLKGEFGRLNVHQSGKITIDLGNGIILNVTKGSPADFLQELTMVELDSKAAKDPNSDEMDMVDDEGKEIAGKVMRLGTVRDKIIATPCI
ncbi:uncharacterized protein LODBEIA_P48470 [Lodderomyces beijingensis]|uniref:DNA-directed RNA polymerase III subunit RPC4 n=1 Tax=Lodderomyces beijingensis TaxID=1775926 RepID=A0ABP0ZSF4_9ASCO